jgi:endonuclease-3
MPPRKKAATGEPAKAVGGRARKAESVESRRARATKLIKELHRLHPDATCALQHRSALELVVSTILSAQCTDDRVNMVTPVLFKRYRTAADFAGADRAEIEGLIRSTGFFRNKAKSIIGLGRVVVERFKGEVPSTMEDLLELPGVARKTANVVLGTWFDKNVGVVVDTHIGRLSHRLGLTWRSKDDKDAVRIEQDLMEVLPQAEWTFVGHALIWHGRRVCAARKPDCGRCSLAEWCPSAFAFDAEAKKAEGKNRS